MLWPQEIRKEYNHDSKTRLHTKEVNEETKNLNWSKRVQSKIRWLIKYWVSIRSKVTSEEDQRIDDSCSETIYLIHLLPVLIILSATPSSQTVLGPSWLVFSLCWILGTRTGDFPCFGCLFGLFPTCPFPLSQSLAFASYLCLTLDLLTSQTVFPW